MQKICPVPQVVLHLPSLQMCPAEQTRPQAPQLLLSLVMLAQ